MRRRRKPAVLVPGTTRSSLEIAFMRAWELVHGLTLRPVQQHRFAAPDRQWRFDFAWPEQKVAVEIDGGIFVHGGHNRGMQMTADHEKANYATIRGWRVLRYGTKAMQQRPIQIVEEVGNLLLAEKPQRGLFS